MENLVLKNYVANIIIGSLLILFSVLGYFMNWIEDFLPIIIGAVLILLSAKRFWYSFKRLVSKNATLILIIELILDLLFGGLLIYLQDHVELFIGLIIYVRGVSYLVINYVATRKVKLFQYLLNIGFLTFGAFLMFADLNSLLFLTLFVSFLILLVGAIFLQAGLVYLTAKEKQDDLEEKVQKKQEETEKVEKKIDKLEQKVKTIDKETQKLTDEKKQIEEDLTPSKKTQKPTPPKPKNEFESKTVAELKEIAKELKLTGYSQLNKPQLVDLIVKTKQDANKK